MMRNSYKKKFCLVAASSIMAMSFASYAFAADATADDADTMEFTLDSMVVTASRIPTKITEAKADISVITRKDIEQMHMSSVEEVLRTVPGVQFLNYGGNGGMNANMSGIRINGSKEVVVLVDGVRVNEFQGSDSGYRPESSCAKSVCAMKQRCWADWESAADRFAAAPFWESSSRCPSKWQRSRDCHSTRPKFREPAAG